MARYDLFFILRFIPSDCPAKLVAFFSIKAAGRLAARTPRTYIYIYYSSAEMRARLIACIPRDFPHTLKSAGKIWRRLSRSPPRSIPQSPPLISREMHILSHARVYVV